MMFQSYALFLPHLSVAGNIAFGLRQDGLAKAAIAARLTKCWRSSSSKRAQGGPTLRRPSVSAWRSPVHWRSDRFGGA